MSKQELTPWFVNGEKPSESGVYKVRSRGFKGFSYWDSIDGWGPMADTPNEAFADRESGAQSDFFHGHGRGWRGPSIQPKAKP